MATTAGFVVGSVLTVAYSARFAATVLARPAPGAPPVPAPRASFVAPAAVLAGLTVAGGLAVSALVEPLTDGATQALAPGSEHVHLALWHGFGVPLALSALTVALGAALVVGRDRVARVQAALAPRTNGDDVFAGLVHGLNVVAGRVTGVVQSGSLPVYLAVTLLTAVVTPAAAVVLHGRFPGWPAFAETPLQVFLAAALVAAALVAAVTDRRFVAVVLLGVVGYTMGLIFVVQGAPDLALTQFSVETLSIVVFMLVLRYLPSGFKRRAPAMVTWVRAVIASTVAVGVFALTIISTGSRTEPSVSAEVLAAAEEDGAGDNVVNVVLVDIRGLDTLGEISVLVLAAVGVVALARADRRPRGHAPPESDDESTPPAPEAVGTAKEGT